MVGSGLFAGLLIQSILCDVTETKCDTR